MACGPQAGHVGDEAEPDYEYGYGDALRDGRVVRPVYFPRLGGEMEWQASDGEVHAATFEDPLAAELAQKLQAYKERNKTVSLDQRKDIVSESLKVANLEAQKAGVALQGVDSKLSQIRDYRAKGLDLTGLAFIAEPKLVQELQQQLRLFHESLYQANKPPRIVKQKLYQRFVLPC